MDKVIKRIQIDLYSLTCHEVIKAQQGDGNSRIIELEILNQGEPYTLSNVFAKFEGHRGDGSSFIKDCSILDNIVSVVLDEDVLYYAGCVEAKIVLYDLSDESVLSTVSFRIHVQKNPCDKNNAAITPEQRNLIDEIIFSISDKANIDGSNAVGTWGINISGNSKSATQDGNGNVIADTYATKEDLENFDNAVELTKAEYDALPDDKLTNDTTYFVKDMEPTIQFIELTKAEYDALSDDKLTNDILYFIKDM